jgi:hypothetical protein
VPQARDEVITLQKREKILAIAAAVVGVLLAGYFLFVAGDSRSRVTLRKERDDARKAVDAQRAKLDAAQKAVAQLADWQRRSLPVDLDTAQTLYLDWLRGIVVAAKFTQPKFESHKGQPPRSKVYTPFTFTVHGRATLSQLTQFLNDFYRAGHLHQIRQLDVKRLENSSDLELVVTIDALSLQKADRTNQLTAEPGKQLKLAKLTDYSSVIGARNLFAPPRERDTGGERERVVTVPPPTFDPALYTFVTAILEVDGEPQVWFHERPNDKYFKLHKGEKLAVGSVSGTVKAITRDEVALDVGGETRQLKEGDRLKMTTEKGGGGKGKKGFGGGGK